MTAPKAKAQASSAKAIVPRPRRPKLTLTRESLVEAVAPANNCQVAAFRLLLDDESLAVFDEAIKYKKEDLAGPRLREWLLGVGFDEDVVPTVEHITAHRQTRRPCRCRG